MFKKSFQSYLIPILFFSISVLSQTKQEKEMNKMMTEMFGLPEIVIPSSQYNNAVLLVDDAMRKLEDGDINAAEKTIRESIELYPTIKVFDYIKQLCLLPDISQANSVMDAVYTKVGYLDGLIIVQEMTPVTRKDGNSVKVERNYDKKRAVFNFAYKISLINKEFGTYDSYIKSLKIATEIPLVKNRKASYDQDYEAQYLFKYMIATAQKDYDKAVQMINDTPLDIHHSIESKRSFLIQIYLEKQDYEKAIELNNQYKEEIWTELKNRNSFKINALQGNNEAALNDLKKGYKKEEEFSREVYYYLAIIDLNKQSYEKAIEDLNQSLNKKGIGFVAEFEGLAVDKYKAYKLMGDAYKGLQQFDKAKDFYNLSLLFYPDYEHAINALANLESVAVTTITTDKTPPGIKITEPVANRGLEIVSAGNDILVKGIATDPSGLKSVTINGVSVYAQKDGNFWGNIPLNAELNKITIIATDGAGNVAEQVFEIKKSNEPVSEVVAATEREANNYCLLIGAQNYDDSSIPSLENPIQDAVRLKLILKKNYGFNDSNIVTLYNPKANDIKRQLLELTNTIQPEDNLLIFYAGHGIWVEKEKKGYWLLVDAKRNDPNTWLQNKEVLELIAKLPSRHTLLITDACFSGGVFKTRSIGKDAPANIQTMNGKISRVAITSGNDTEVPDESVFMKYLVKALSENKDKYLTAQKMFITQIMEAVMTETKTEPRYGTLELAGHVGGDYIFARK